MDALQAFFLLPSLSPFHLNYPLHVYDLDTTHPHTLLGAGGDCSPLFLQSCCLAVAASVPSVLFVGPLEVFACAGELP